MRNELLDNVDEPMTFRGGIDLNVEAQYIKNKDNSRNELLSEFSNSQKSQVLAALNKLYQRDLKLCKILGNIE